jgi:hypothetical protein
MPESGAKAKTETASLREEEHLPTSLPPLRVRYYRQMKPQRVYIAEVSWQGSARAVRGEVTVRLIAAGAQVLPTEQVMDAALPGTKAFFYVTPLARGWLRNEKLEVLVRGRKVQEIPMATKVVSQRLTWFLLLCTFLLPWLILNNITYGPMAHKTRRSAASHDRVFIVANKVDKEALEKELEKGRKNEVLDQYKTKIAKEAEKAIEDNLPAAPWPIKGTIVDDWLGAPPVFVSKAFESLIFLGGADVTADGTTKKAAQIPLAYYTLLAFLVMTLLSAFFHMPKIRSTKSKPISVPDGVARLADD